uniref:Uncharacterized protein n=1 Tax=Schistosoma curassoni TaxID=6186 RepID=A0A183KLD0_9TREM
MNSIMRTFDARNDDDVNEREDLEVIVHELWRI